ncbi:MULTISPECIES: hypothetical protein [unclassified Spirosoma]|uniref:hypothetical protein n=1 Tax=unclassified Spirosoma TaxID=2621999 RepID=UPI001AC69B2F|nr:MULTISPECIES: hypothetical protein [unclassified Spirosoma]MBN8820844.1 hypothetical protein [Spirosoma sp.]
MAAQPNEGVKVQAVRIQSGDSLIHQPSRALGELNSNKQRISRLPVDRPHVSTGQLWGSLGGFGRHPERRSWGAFWSPATRETP